MDAQNPVSFAQVGRIGAPFSGPNLFLFQQVSARHQLEAIPSARTLTYEEEEEGGAGKRMKLADGTSLASPASRPLNIPVGCTWTLAAPREAKEDDDVSGPPSFLFMDFFCFFNPQHYFAQVSFSEGEVVPGAEGRDHQDFRPPQVTYEGLVSLYL